MEENLSDAFSPTDVCFASSDTSPHADQSARDLEIWLGIGELGIRRGFKGAPLFTAAIDSKPTFLAVPSTSSPRTPRTPLVTMSNLMKPSPSKSDKQRLVCLVVGGRAKHLDDVMSTGNASEKTGLVEGEGNLASKVIFPGFFHHVSGVTQARGRECRRARVLVVVVCRRTRPYVLS